MTPDEQQALGDLTANFSQLEAMTGYFICHLMKIPDETGRFLLGRIDISGQLGALSALYEHRFASDADKALVGKMRDTIAKVQTARQARNEVMHSFWAAGGTVTCATAGSSSSATARDDCINSENHARAANPTRTARDK